MGPIKFIILYQLILVVLWWWSSGQRAHLLFWLSEFESHQSFCADYMPSLLHYLPIPLSLQFLCGIFFTKVLNNREWGRVWLMFFTKNQPESVTKTLLKTVFDVLKAFCWIRSKSERKSFFHFIFVWKNVSLNIHSFHII